jgi:hypothetical protein
MLFISVEAVNSRYADLRRAADEDRRHPVPRTGHGSTQPEPRRRRRRRAIRAATVAAPMRGGR